MGVICQDLYDHEGVALRRLPDGTLTSTWSATTHRGTSLVAGCACGWHGEIHYPPTEAGEELALEQWRWEHAEPLLARQAEQRRGELVRLLAWLGTHADQLEDPATLRQVRGGLDRARGLVADLQRDLERTPSEWEAGGAR